MDKRMISIESKEIEQLIALAEKNGGVLSDKEIIQTLPDNIFQSQEDLQDFIELLYQKKIHVVFNENREVFLKKKWNVIKEDDEKRYEQTKNFIKKIKKGQYRLKTMPNSSADIVENKALESGKALIDSGFIKKAVDRF